MATLFYAEFNVVTAVYIFIVI